MKKAIKIPLIVVGSLILLIIIGSAIYLVSNIQGVVETTEEGNPDADKKLLIASQGSDFKNKLVQEIKDGLNNVESLYIKIIDVTGLQEVDANKWDAIVLINSLQGGKVQKDVETFLNKADKVLDKIILFVTTGAKEVKEFNVDTITAASKMSEIDKLVTKIMAKLGKLF